MSLLSRLAEKSWETPGIDGLAEPDSYRPAAAQVGLYVYFGVACVLFSLIVGAYLVRMGMGVHGAATHGTAGDWRPMPEPPLLWINSAVLVASSLAWEVARRAARTLAWDDIRRMALIGAGLGLLFLAGQLLLWRQYQAGGYYLSANPANAFFFLLTAVHGLHLIGGVVACVRVVGQFGARGDQRRAARNIRLCAVYWHFLLLVWVLLAGLLVST
ncbi:MAG TPA: cytochrome c oxidase subunit 3 [Novosphingobium sp.]|nr:cytochrome c oxidase subunit 3 [Novosphingobium sp.]